MNLDPKKLDAATLKRFAEARQSPQKFAEHFLVDPSLKTPFKANHVQQKIFNCGTRDVWICVHRRAGKCVTDETTVLHPVTMRPVSIREAQDFNRALVFDFEQNRTIWSPCEWVASGTKRCVRLSLETGIDLTLSDDHQVFCKRRGWIPVANIHVGDQILAPSKIDVEAIRIPTPEEMELALDRTLADDRFPDEIFSYREDWLRRFLAGFFTAKGRILEKESLVAFMLWNKALAHDFHHLLLRIGVVCRIDEDGNVFIEDPIDHAVFLRSCGYPFPVTEVHSPRRWERVIGRKGAGTRPVYDLCVMHPDHGFVGSDVVLHNSYSLSLIALWHAIFHENRKVVLFAPSTTQVDEFFTIIDAWINNNDILGAMQADEGNFKNPHQRRTFKNGSYIAGYILGVNANVEASRRGLTADVVLVDEGQELSEYDWDVVGPIMRGDITRRNRMRGYVAGTTPKEPVGDFFKRVYKDDRKKKRSEVIFVPIDENPEWTPEMIAEEREEINDERRWNREYLLQITEKSSAVFKNQEINDACADDWEYGPEGIIEMLPRFITVDWDKVQTGTSIGIFQYSPHTKKCTLIYKQMVPQGEFHYMQACRLIMELYQVYMPELVVCDAGMGEMQWEYLTLESARLGLGLAERLVKVAFQERLTVINPVTNEEEKKMLKPFLVGLLQKKFQDRQIQFPYHDEQMKTQFFKYEIVRMTKTGPVFKSDNEHFVDTWLFLMYALWLTHENPLEEKASEQNKALILNQDALLSQDDDEKREAEKAFWNTLESGSRQDLPGVLVPRSDFDDFGRNSGFERF